MKRTILVTAVLSSALTSISLWAFAMPRNVRLENARVRVTEIVYAPGTPRDRHIRATDQVIVFLDDCKYQRIDPQTGEKTVRERKAGEVIWHNRGEVAPVLTNLGAQAYRTLLIELK